ncbi:PREDICTED: protein SPT2 homolog [Fragaria vesca subsp. vesca]|uniref:protein SPT2 homolog n=1 Tax=Fragaria vesca subsp. vesca TaxID=101020 RepID=UPI0002C31518|nr:PREDICTED: protein SPT2 homolog [Fragaria vesca subsp. vesca]
MGYESYDRQRHDRRVEEYDDYEYEGDGYGYEEEGDEYEDEEEEEEEEEEDAPRPTKEALEFLELRQRLKEQIRRDMKRKEGGRGNSDDRKKLPYDKSFGSFFGPSQPVIADRVIQESKSLLETRHLASRATNSVHPNKKNSGSTSSGSKPVAHTQKPNVINEQKNIVQKRKDTRDYAFLFSEDAELPAPAKDRPPRSDSAPTSEVRSSQTVMKSKQPLVNNSRPLHGGQDNGRSIHGRDSGRPVQGSRDNGRPVHGSRDNRAVHGSHDNGRPVHGSRDSGRPVQGSRDSGRPVQGSRDSGRPVQGSRDSGRPVQGSRENGRPVHGSHDNGRPVMSGHDERKAIPTNGHMHSKVGSNRPSSASSRPGSTSMDSRKQLGSNNANGPGRPLVPKGLPSKMPASTLERRVSAPGLKNNMSSLQKAPSSKSQSSLLKQPLQQRKDVREPYKPSMLSKQSTGLSKHQIHKPQMHKQVPSRPMSQEYRPKKRPASGFADDEYDPEDGDISSMIRNMFGYNPNKFADDDDVSDMEAGFEDIQREERRSAKIARMEDEEQARLIEEEERRERLAAKMRKQKKLKR